MKKLLALIPAMAIIWAFAGCGGSDYPTPETPEPEYDEEVAGVDEVGEPEPVADEEMAPEGEADEIEETPDEEPPPEEPPAEEKAEETSVPGADEEAVEAPPIEGKIVSGNKKKVVIDTSAEPPEVGKTGTLFKWFTQNIFGMTTTGWLDIAAVEVTAVKGQKITLTVLEEHSEMTVNDKPINHFKKNNKVKLEID